MPKSILNDLMKTFNKGHIRPETPRSSWASRVQQTEIKTKPKSASHYAMGWPGERSRTIWYVEYEFVGSVRYLARIHAKSQGDRLMKTKTARNTRQTSVYIRAATSKSGDCVDRLVHAKHKMYVTGFELKGVQTWTVTKSGKSQYGGPILAEE